MQKNLLIAILVIALVGVAGYLLWQQTQNSKMSRQNTQAQNEFTGFVPSKVEGWQTHRSEEYGFEVKYPPEWRFESGSKNEKGESFVFVSRHGKLDNITLTIFEKVQGVMLNQWIDDNIPKENVIIKKEGLMGNLKIIETVEIGYTNFLVTYLASDDYVFLFNLGESSHYFTPYFQIISTFKFIK